MRGTTPSRPVMRSPAWWTSGRLRGSLITQCRGFGTDASAWRARQASTRRAVEYRDGPRDRTVIFNVALDSTLVAGGATLAAGTWQPGRRRNRLPPPCG